MKFIVRCVLAALIAFSLLAADALGATRYGQRTLRRGTHGGDVKTMQRYLSKVGLTTSADGAFGRGTEKKVKTFERKFKQHANGVLSRNEQKVLKRAAAAQGTVAGSGGATSDTAPKTTTSTAPTGKATINADGTANAPADAPPAIKKLIAAGNVIAHRPYVYGGGHASYQSSGYDCSGSVSYVLHYAGLLNGTRTSGGLESWGVSGRGRWLSVYANSGHTYLRVAGIRFDTSGLSQDGTRWHTSPRSDSGFVFRHWAGL